MIWSVLFSGCAAQNEPKPIAAANWSKTHFQAPDGTEFAYSTWLPKTKPKKVILAVHGLSGAASDWRPLGEHCQKHGVAVYGYELRGMGNDPLQERRGDLADAKLWFEDFTSFALRLQLTHPDTPIVWYGESLGGIITLNMMQRRQEQHLTPSAYVLSSPIVGVDGKIGGWKEAMVKTMIALQPMKRLSLFELAGDRAKEARVVSGVSHEEQLKQTPHAVSSFTLRLLGHIARLVRENQRILRQLDIPTLVLYGGKDIFTPASEVESMFELIPPAAHKQKEFYADGFHLLLHDKDRELVLRRVDNWLENVVPAGRK